MNTDQIGSGIGRLFGVVCLATALAILCGCNMTPPVPTGTVTGQIKFRGKPLMAGCFVTFVSDAGQGASGTTDAQGQYSLRTLDGPTIPTGNYTVTVKPPGQPPMDPDEATRAAAAGKLPQDPFPDFPKKYTNTETSGLRFEVKQGAQAFDFELME